MRTDGAIVLVTGANRGLGRAFTKAFLDAGAAKVYAAARNLGTLGTLSDPRLVPVRLDVTSERDAMAAAEGCGDVSILVNNAGVMLSTPALADGAVDAICKEMDVNVYGLLRMTRAFAPVLRRNGGGAVANVLSVVTWFTLPQNATYCASKHAALSVTDALRIELRAQGTQVLGVHAGYIDTDMAAGPRDEPKTDSRQVADRTIQGIRSGATMVLADARAEQTWASVKPA